MRADYHGTDENGTKTVHKSFAITAKALKQKESVLGLGPTKARAGGAILKVLNEKRNASSYTTRKCRDRASRVSWNGTTPSGPVQSATASRSRTATAMYFDSKLTWTAARNQIWFERWRGVKRLKPGIDFDIATLLTSRGRGARRPARVGQQVRADLLTELHGEVAPRTRARRRGQRRRRRWDRP